jgi:CubicO group peptidase (beta-lactamase class C family)
MRKRGHWRAAGVAGVSALLFLGVAQASARFDAARLDRQLRNEPGLGSVLVERNDRLLFAGYYHGDSESARLDVFSVTKSVVSTLVGIAAHQGLLRLDERLGDFFPKQVRAARDRRVRSITLRQLLSMRSGYRDTMQLRSDDWIHSLVARPLATDPGRSFAYDNGSYHLLSAVLTKATGMTARQYAERVLFRQLRISGAHWSSDGQGHSLGNTGLRLSAREMLALGQLYLHGGLLHGRRIVPAAYVRAATQAKVGSGYGLGWWIVHSAQLSGFAALGYDGQAIAVFPTRNLVVTVAGGGDDVRRVLFAIVLPSLNLR